MFLYDYRLMRADTVCIGGVDYFVHAWRDVKAPPGVRRFEFDDPTKEEADSIFSTDNPLNSFSASGHIYWRHAEQRFDVDEEQTGVIGFDSLEAARADYAASGWTITDMRERTKR